MPNQSGKSDIKQTFKKRKFDVEHALSIFAYSYCTIPASGIYENEMLAPLMSIIENCHIYLIGYLPKIHVNGAQQKGSNLEIKLEMLGRESIISYSIPPNCILKQDGAGDYLEDVSGDRYWPNEQDMVAKFSSVSGMRHFEVKYIGQAYGKGGSRNAIDRLLKHETLQKISLRGVPNDHELTLLMLSIQPSNQLITVFNPFAKSADSGDARIKSGLDKLYNTTEEERISLYEAALIRYFYPEFNKEFKDSFPSTNLKILQDCYEKDFSAVIAEICHDELPFLLWSNKVTPKLYHIAKHDLHKEEDRKMFFGL